MNLLDALLTVGGILLVSVGLSLLAERWMRALDEGIER